MLAAIRGTEESSHGPTLNAEEAMAAWNRERLGGGIVVHLVATLLAAGCSDGSPGMERVSESMDATTVDRSASDRDLSLDAAPDVEPQLRRSAEVFVGSMRTALGFSPFRLQLVDGDASRLEQSDREEPGFGGLEVALALTDDAGRYYDPVQSPGRTPAQGRLLFEPRRLVVEERPRRWATELCLHLECHFFQSDQVARPWR